MVTVTVKCDKGHEQEEFQVKNYEEAVKLATGEATCAKGGCRKITLVMKCVKEKLKQAFELPCRIKTAD